MDLTNTENIKALLRRYLAHPVRDFGQNFLIDQSVLEKIISTANLNENDLVVEVGPGLGVLTAELIKRVKKVYAFEYDPYMQKILNDIFSNEIQSEKLVVVGGDVLRTAPNVLAQLSNYKLVANIPYQITSPLICLFLENSSFSRPKQITIMVQNEVGDRLSAKPGKSARSFLSIMAQFYAEVDYIQKVLPSSFWPQPSVESAIINMNVKEKFVVKEDEVVDFLNYVRRYFDQRRKQLKNVIAGIRGTSQTEIERRLQVLGLANNVRAQELSMDQWVKLFRDKI